MKSWTQFECSSDQSAVHPLRPAAVNRAVTKGSWPDEVDFPIYTGTLRKGDTLYIPAYHWHFVATTTPAVLGTAADEGPLATSVNYWWWPIHNEDLMERWSYQNEEESWANRRLHTEELKKPHTRESHSASFYRLCAKMKEEARQQPPTAAASSPAVAARNGGQPCSKQIDEEQKAAGRPTTGPAPILQENNISMPEYYEAVD